MMMMIMIMTAPLKFNSMIGIERIKKDDLRRK